MRLFMCLLCAAASGTVLAQQHAAQSDDAQFGTAPLPAFAAPALVGNAVLMNPALIALNPRVSTSYGVGYDLNAPTCEVNRDSERWSSWIGVPELGTGLVLRNPVTGHTTVCTVVGTIGDGAHADRVVSVSPHVARVLGLDAEQGVHRIEIDDVFLPAGTRPEIRSAINADPRGIYQDVAPVLGEPFVSVTMFPDVMMATTPVDLFTQPPAPPVALSLMPSFTWPAPQPSGRFSLGVAFPEALADAATLGDVDAALLRMVRGAAYEGLGYYHLPGGFALVTQWENIDDSGVPLSEPHRWVQVLERPNMWNPFNILVWLLQDEVPVGRSRVFVFAVTNDPQAASDRHEDPDIVRAWTLHGLDALPHEVAAQAYTEGHGVSVLIYEFEKTTATDGRLISPSGTPPMTHAVNAGLIPPPN